MDPFGGGRSEQQQDHYWRISRDSRCNGLIHGLGPTLLQRFEGARDYGTTRGCTIAAARFGNALYAVAEGRRIDLRFHAAFDYPVSQGDFFVSNVIDLFQRLGLEGELPRGPHSMLPLAAVMAPGKRDEEEEEEDVEDDDDFEDDDEDEDEDDFDDDEDEDDFDEDEDEDEDDEDEDDEDYDDDDEDDGEENSLTPRRAPLRRVA